MYGSNQELLASVERFHDSESYFGGEQKVFRL